MSNNIPKAESRSKMVTTYGPGAIVNLRSPKGAPISVVAGGLEDWDAGAPPAGLKNSQRCHLSRLERKLGVEGFRLAPVSPENQRDDNRPRPHLPALRFPVWLTCPKCFRLQEQKKWQKDTDRGWFPERWCGFCTGQEMKKNRVYAVPVRFVLACSNGHLDEFPWYWWLTNQPAVNKEKEGKQGCLHQSFKLFQGSSLSLASLQLSCVEKDEKDKICGRTVSMKGATNPKTFLSRLSCEGRRPWLSTANESCDQVPVAVQRNSSSLYLPKFKSAIDIPPWTNGLQQQLHDWWLRLNKIDNPESRLARIKVNLEDIQEECGLEDTAEQLNGKIQQLKDLDNNSDPDLRVDEYKVFTDPELESTEEFRARKMAVPEEFSGLVSRVVSIERLREVRANRCFSRLKDSNKACDLAETQKNWLPAIEVRGEGIFLGLDQENLARWESGESVKDRTESLRQAYEENARRREVAEEEREVISARTVLIHTLSHLLVRAIALDCGYSAASLRERIYATGDMAGILVYTSTPDSEGTLGGLSRLAAPGRFGSILRRLRDSAQRCSSDPLCIEGVTSYSEPMNGSACHACLLLPETSCERFNVLLDRGLVCGEAGSSLPSFFA